MFSNKNLSVISFANGWTMWHYVDNGLPIEKLNESFFSQVKNLMNPGDKVLISLKGWWIEAIITMINDGKVYLTYITKTPLGE